MSDFPIPLIKIMARDFKIKVSLSGKETAAELDKIAATMERIKKATKSAADIRRANSIEISDLKVETQRLKFIEQAERLEQRRARAAEQAAKARVSAEDKYGKQALADIRRAESERLRIITQNEKAIEKLHKQEADSKIKEGKRASTALIQELNKTKTASEQTARQSRGVFSNTLGASFFGNLGANAVTFFASQLAQLPSRVKGILDEAVKVAQERANALTGLKSTAGAFGVGADEATETVKNLRLVRGGVVSLTEASTALKNLIATGFSLPQAIQLLERFSDTAAFGKQAALGYGQAIQGATEGIKNQNSILVDNVGITKNLSVILKERGFQLEDLSNKQTRASALQALYNGLLEESRAQVGDADKLLNSYTGTIAAQTTAVTLLYNAVGTAIINNQVWIESNKIVTEQILGVTASVEGATSSTDNFTRTLIEHAAVIQATFSSVAKIITNILKITLHGFAGIVAGVSTAVVAVVETATGAVVGLLNFVNSTMEGVLNALITSINGISNIIPLFGGAQIPLVKAPTITNPLSGLTGQLYNETKKSAEGVVSGFRDIISTGKELDAVMKRLAEASRRQDELERERIQKNDPKNFVPYIQKTRQQFKYTAADYIREGYTRDQLIKAGIPLTDINRELAGVQGVNVGGGGSGVGGKTKSLSQKDRIDQLVQFNANRTGLDPDLIRALIGVESSGNLRAVSPKGAGGLMQLIPGTASRFGVKNRFDPAQNIRGGTDYLLQLLEQFNGNLPLALAAYNAGEGAVQKYGNKIPPYKETQNYVRDVLQKYAQLKGAGEQGTVLSIGGQNSLVSSNTIAEIVQGFIRSENAKPVSTTIPSLTNQFGTIETSDEEFRRTRNEAVARDEATLSLRAQNIEQEKFLALKSQTIGLENEYFDLEVRLATLQASASDEYLTNLRQVNRVAGEKIDLEQRLLDLGDEMVTGGVNQSLRVQVALMEDVLALRKREEEAIISINRSQLELSQQTIYSANQANASVLQFLASQKGITEIVADAKIGVIQTTFNFVDKGLDKLTSKLGIFGDLLKSILSDLIRLALSKVFQQIFNLGGQRGEGGGGGGIGGFFGSILGALGIGRNAQPGASRPATVNLAHGGGIQSNLAQSLQSIGIGGITAPESIHTAGVAARSSTQGVGGLASGGAAALGGGAGKFSFGQFLGGLAPGLGASFGALAGGQSVGGQILGSIGGLLGGLVVAASTGAIGGSLGGAFALSGALGPAALIAAPLLILGAILLGRKKQRKADEKQRDAIFGDAITQMRTILSDVSAIPERMDGEEGKSRATTIFSEWEKGVSQIKTRSVRNSAIQNQKPVLISLQNQISAAADAQAGRKTLSDKLTPEFAGGFYIPGTFDGRDDILAFLSRGEMVLNPTQQKKIKQKVGFDPFAYADIPNYKPAKGTPRFETGAFISTGGQFPSLSSQTGPAINFTGNFEVHLSEKEFSEVVMKNLQSDEGKRVTFKVINDGKKSGDV